MIRDVPLFTHIRIMEFMEAVCKGTLLAPLKFLCFLANHANIIFDIWIKHNFTDAYDRCGTQDIKTTAKTFSSVAYADLTLVRGRT